MTQQVCRARTMLPNKSPLLATASFDTYWEALGTDTSLDTAYIISQLTAFINSTASGATNPMSYYMSESLSTASNAVMIDIYDITAHLDGSPAGSVIAMGNFTLGTPHATSFPTPEGASALFSYHADYGTDVEFGPHTRPRARDRNRFYLGPMGAAGLGFESSTNRCIWNSTFVTDATASFQALKEAQSEPHATTMVQWSRVNAAVKQLDGAWLDDAPRYQRRRDKAKGAHDITF